jgi:hypothetical protein
VQEARVELGDGFELVPEQRREQLRRLGEQLDEHLVGDRRHGASVEV